MKFKDTLANLFYRAGDLALGYDASDTGRFRNVLRAGRSNYRSEDELMTPWDREKIRQRCLDLRRNNAIVAGVVERFADNVVGSVITPQAKTDSREFNDEAEAYWKEWSKVCDYRQRIQMPEFQRTAVSSRMLSGDFGIVLTSAGQLQPVEGERIQTPKAEEATPGIIEGVKLDPKTGIPSGYYVFNRDKTGGIDTTSNDYELIPRENFIFISKPFRFDQVRGIPDLAPVVNALQDHRELTEATTQKAKLDAMNAWIVKRDGATGPGNLGPRGRDTAVEATQLERVESGMIHYMRPGEDMASLKSNTPSPEYASFIELNLRLIGAALGLPYEFLLLDFSKGSYSSSRAALLQTYRTFTGWQEWLTRVMLQRLWNWRIAKAIKARELRPAPQVNGVSQWFRVDWSYPEFGWVDPQSEATAAQIEYNMGTNTLTQINRKKGRDAEDVLREKGGDIAMAISVAKEINDKHGTALTWRDLISTSIPGQTAPTNDKPADSGKKTDGAQ